MAQSGTAADSKSVEPSSGGVRVQIPLAPLNEMESAFDYLSNALFRCNHYMSTSGATILNVELPK